MPVILGANSASGGYNISNSLRLNSGSTDYLNKTFSLSNKKTWTWSGWVKRSKLSSNYFALFSTGTYPYLFQFMYNTSDDTLRILNYDNTNVTLELQTSAVYRDVSAWYHVVLSVDTTQATDTNRAKLYVNGSQITSFNATTYPSQNADLEINKNQSHFIGLRDGNLYPFDGYMSDVFFIDGQALTPSSFGETDEDTGIWKPKAFSGTYGTNGFYLQFKNSSSLGTDSSGNGNTFTVNNLTSIDQTTDTPTNNFATLNPLVATGGTYTEGNLQYQTATTDGNWSWSSITPSSGGNWYCEAKMISSSNGTYQVGITAATNGTPRILYVSNGAVYLDGSNVATYATYTTNDIIGMAYNSSTKSLTFYKNGVSQGSQTASSTNDYYFGSMAQSGGATHTVAFNFGNPPYSANSYTDGAGYGNFSYSVPSGYYALNTKNLAQFG